MPRIAKLPLRKTDSGRWCYDLPPVFSETGKRQRKTFKNKKLAELARTADLEAHKLYGTERAILNAAQTLDAKKALELLQPYGASLTVAAAAYAQVREREKASRPFADLWKHFLATRERKSDKHYSSLKALGEKLAPEIGQMLVAKIDHDTLRTALRKCYPTAFGFNLALRSVSPAFNMAVKEGWATENPCKRIDKVDTGRREIEVLTLNQCRKLFEACKDYRQDETLKEYQRVDCTDAAPAMALLLFAGVRPNELVRLDWGDIDMAAKTVLVRNTKAKTDRTRYFSMPDTLFDWLNLVPSAERSGQLVPPSWKRVNAVVRKKAGIDGMHDVCRKTFATAHLGAFNDVNLTRSIMGHEVGDVLFSHYRGLMKPSDAVQFWQIIPGNVDIKLEVV